jgi:hypothetical protein
VSFQLIYVTEIFNKYFAVVFVFVSVVYKSLFCHEYFINNIISFSLLLNLVSNIFYVIYLIQGVLKKIGVTLKKISKLPTFVQK